MTVWDRLVGQDVAVAPLGAAARVARAIVASAEHGEITAELISLTGESAPVPTAAMTHAWLLTGPPGSGRSVAARAFAAALQCDDAAELGCGHCNSCRTTLAGTHPDVHAVVPEGLSISVAEMRTVVTKAARRPTHGKWQVVVIEDADRLTEAASNALLKAVEEPPERTVFLLCAPSTHPDDVAVTIRSRCRHVALRTPSAASVTSVLVKDGVQPEQAEWAAQAAQGHVGRAKRLANDEQARQSRAAVLAIPASLTSLHACMTAADQLVNAAEAEASTNASGRNAEEVEALKVALGAGGTGKGAVAAARGSAGALKELEKRQKSRSTRSQRDALDRSLTDLAAFYRDVLLIKSGSAFVAQAHPDFAAQVRDVADQVSSAQALQRLEAVLACRTALDLNVRPRIAVEAMTAVLRLPA